VGVAADVPCAAVSHAATSRQSFAACRLGEFDSLECGPAPLLLLIGRAMESLVLGQAEDAAVVIVEAVAGVEAQEL